MLPSATVIALSRYNRAPAYLLKETDGAAWRRLAAPPDNLVTSLGPSLAAGYATPESCVHICGLYDWDNNEHGGRIWHQRFEPATGWSEQVDVIGAAGGGRTAHDMYSVAGWCRRGFPEGPPPFDFLTLYICTTDGRITRVERSSGGQWAALEDVFSTHGVAAGNLSASWVAAAMSPSWHPDMDVEHIVASTNQGLWYASRRYSSIGLQRTVFSPLPLPSALGGIACSASQSQRALHLCYVSSQPFGRLLHTRLRPGSRQAIDPQGGIWDSVTDVGISARILGFPSDVACGVSGEVLHLTTLVRQSEFLPRRAVYTSRSEHTNWSRFDDLAAELGVVVDANSEPSAPAVFVPGPLTTAVRYGATLKLRHVATDCSLHSHPFAYSHPGSSGQQQVTCFAGADDNDLWRINGPHGQPDSFRSGVPVGDGDVVRLKHLATGRNLHSHSGFPSPVTGQQEVTCYGESGVGDGNDDWRVEVDGDGQWDAATQIRLVHVLTNVALHSHGGFSHPQWTMGQQEVTGFAGRDGNDLWVASDVLARDARFVSQSAPATLLPGQSQDVSIRMRNLGTETWTQQRQHRLGSQNPPDNQRWGLGRIDVPGPIAPGQEATFSFRVTAPSTSGIRPFQWRMLREGVEWFGDPSPQVGVRVFSSAGPTTVPDVEGMGRRDADQTIRAADLVPSFIGASGRFTEVAQQSPAAGTSVGRGSTVTLTMRLS